MYASFSDEQLAICLLNLAEANEKLHGAAEMEATIAVLTEAAKRLRCTCHPESLVWRVGDHWPRCPAAQSDGTSDDG